jgi:chromosome segregation ATPase
MLDGHIDAIKKDLSTIRLGIEELEKSLKSFAQKDLPSEEEGSMACSEISLEEKQKEIKNEIEKLEKRLELLAERKTRLEEIKKDAENKEAQAKNPTERRAAEEQRFLIEEQRNLVEEERDKKESEIKLLKLALEGSDKFDVEKTDQNINLNKNLDLTALDEEKQNLLLELQRIETLTSQLKDFIQDIVTERAVLNSKLAEISELEKEAEKNIKDFEAKLTAPLSVDEAKEIESQRNIFEEKRRAAERVRWDAEDEIEKIETIYSKAKTEYQIIPISINNIKERLSLVNKKIDSIDNEHV